ncbi:MAG: transposase [Alphaproteobacteria bacterium]|nr:transposase [Alphaproteobacteria bacterium]
MSDHLERLSVAGGPLEILSGCVDFEFFHETFDAGLKYSRSKRSGRPPYDPVAMLKILVFASRHNMNDERMEFLIRDRLGWLRFPSLQLGQATPDAPVVLGTINGERHAGCCILRCRSSGQGILSVSA